jgi:hypothetical protein
MLPHTYRSSGSAALGNVEGLISKPPFVFPAATATKGVFGSSVGEKKASAMLMFHSRASGSAYFVSTDRTTSSSNGDAAGRSRAPAAQTRQPATKIRIIV